VSLTAVLSVLSGCAAGWNHTSDAELAQRFGQHEREFESLLAVVKADEGLSMIGPGELSYGGRLLTGLGGFPSDVEGLKLTRETWAAYQRSLRTLSLARIRKSERRIEFTVDGSRILNGDSEKGYCYASTPPFHLRENLDAYRISETDEVDGGWGVAKRLRGNWYLYVFVSR
jgi:hypothetical protein